ncbi:MAG: CapA family protein [Candidatus Promineifilaceae bacterium]
MNGLRRKPILFFLLIMLLSGCAPGAELAQQAGSARAVAVELSPTLLPPTPSLTPPAAPPPTSAAPTPAPSASPTLQPSPSPEPAAVPSSTPLPVFTLSVPDSWEGRAKQAIAELNNSATTHSWRLEESDEADVRLVNNQPGVLVTETSLALSVPFTTAWESVTYDQALEIMEQGDELVTVIPWPEMKPGQKALRIDGLGPADEGYSLKETWSLAADDEAMGNVSDLVELLRERSHDEVVHLVAVGDIMLDRSLGYNLTRGDLAYPFSSVADRLQGADITVGNMESALGNRGEPQLKRYPFRAPPEAAQSLALAGFDIVSLANNHGMDYGPDALLQALDLLQQHGVMPVGAGANNAAAHAPAVVEIDGLIAAVFGYVNVPVEASTGFDTASWTATADQPGIAWGDPQTITADVQAVRDEVDLVIVLLHSGFEYQGLPSEPQIEAAHAAVDAGADLVVGHHAHILQGIEQYKDGVIIYGTGNFAFDIDGPPETAIFHVWLDKNGVREVAVEAAIIQFGGQPRLAASWEAPAILSRLYYLSNQLGD